MWEDIDDFMDEMSGLILIVSIILTAGLLWGRITISEWVIVNFFAWLVASGVVGYFGGVLIVLLIYGTAKAYKPVWDWMCRVWRGLCDL